MAKFTGIAEQYDGGQDIFIQQESSHVQISVAASTDCRAGVALVTPDQARAIAKALITTADAAAEYAEIKS